MIRHFFVWLHRWTGLLMTVFLILVGLTGSLLAFKTDLERLVCPRIYATPRAGVPPLDLATLAERAQAQVLHGHVVTVALLAPDQALVVFHPDTDPASGKPYELGFAQFFADPWTGQELGRRNFGDLSQGLINLMPFIYDLHASLTFGGTGARVLGIVALVWTIDCFVGFYLTLPVSARSFWRRWKPAWLVKWSSGAYRLNFDLHRAGGLWVWPMLLIFAWSSVMLNLGPVYAPVTAALFDYPPPESEYPAPVEHAALPRLGFRQAVSAAENLLAEKGAQHGFKVVRPVLFSWFQGLYYYVVVSSRDIDDRYGETFIFIDGDTGDLKSLHLPTGEHSGSTFSTWLRALHMADVFGTAYRALVAVLGILITMLSVTGVYVWWKKRKARLRHRSRPAADRSAVAYAAATGAVSKAPKR